MTEATQILQGNALFTNKLYQILARKPGNVFFSPFSIHAVLSMAYQGAQGRTAENISETLQIPDAKSTAFAYKSILDRLKSTEDVVLYMAYKIYARKQEKFIERFENDVREYFYSEVEVLDFGLKEEAVKKINQWVAEKTLETIGSIVDEDSIEDTTALFLLNVIYFKAEWEDEFDEDLTKSHPFYLGEEKKVDVQMMNGKKHCFYKDDEELSAQILSLPYQGQKIKMVIVLPKERTGIKNLEVKLASANLTQVTKGLSGNKVNLFLPKFKLETTIELKEMVEEMGLELIFDKCNANFKGMLKMKPNENLCVDKILQKAVIDVNEKGSEAAVVTGLEMEKMTTCCRRRRPVISFVVDHPAIFMLVEGSGQNTNILFFGRLSHPE